jgi:hypothetical protein
MVKTGILFPPFFFILRHRLRAWRTGLSRKAKGGLDRTVEAMCQNVTKNSQRPTDRPSERRFPSVAHAQKSRIKSRRRTRMSDPNAHPNLHPNFFMSSKWFLSDCSQNSAGFHAVLNISGNCFLSGNEWASPLLPQGAYLVKEQVVQNSQLSAAINTCLFRKRTDRVSSRCPESVLQCPENVAECPRRHVSRLTRYETLPCFRPAFAPHGL